MPLTVKQMLPPNSVVLDAHEFLETMQRPNDIIDGYTTLELIATSLMTCGKSLLTIDDNPGTNPSMYYIPMHWATPVHSTMPYERFKITPTNAGSSYDAARGQFV